MNKQTTTLIVLIPGFPVDETDSTCLPAQQLLIKAINNLYPDLNIIVLTFQYPFISQEYSWYGNRVIPLNGGNRSGLNRLNNWLHAWTKIRRLKNEYDIVGIFSCWCGECALVGKYFSKFFKLKHFTWICGQDAGKANKLIKLIRPNGDSLIAISDFLVDEFFNNHQIKPSHVIPIGIDPAMYPVNNGLQRDIDVIGVGSLVSLKQFDIFIDIIGKIKKEFPGIKTIICGNGPEKERLQNIIINAGLQNNIILCGEKSHQEVILLMQRSKILLHPSAYEGFGAVCMEALYAGAHVVSFVKPLNRKIQHWHIANDQSTMQQKVLELLCAAGTDFSMVMVQDVHTSVRSLIKLFEYNKPV